MPVPVTVHSSSAPHQTLPDQTKPDFAANLAGLEFDAAAAAAPHFASTNLRKEAGGGTADSTFGDLVWFNQCGKKKISSNVSSFHQMFLSSIQATVVHLHF